MVGLKVGDDNVPEEYALNRQVWNHIKTTLNLKRGMMLVFTKVENYIFWMQAFLPDGQQNFESDFLGATTLRRIQPKIPLEDESKF